MRRRKIVQAPKAQQPRKIKAYRRAEASEASAVETQLLSAKEFAVRLGLSDQTVHLREGRQEIFSILAPARKRGREYPSFQLEDKIMGEPLRHILANLHEVSGAEKYQFFTSSNDVLGGLTPVAVLLGIPTARTGTDRAHKLIAMSHESRLTAVLKAATTFVNDLKAR